MENKNAVKAEAEEDVYALMDQGGPTDNRKPYFRRRWMK